MLLDIGRKTLHSFDVPIAFTFQQVMRHNNLRQGSAPLMPLIRPAALAPPLDQMRRFQQLEHPTSNFEHPTLNRRPENDLKL